MPVSARSDRAAEHQRFRVLGPRFIAADRRFEIDSRHDHSVVGHVRVEVERAGADRRFHRDSLARKIHGRVLDTIRADRVAEVREIGAVRRVKRDRTAIAFRNDVRLRECCWSES